MNKSLDIGRPWILAMVLGEATPVVDNNSHKKDVAASHKQSNFLELWKINSSVIKVIYLGGTPEYQLSLVSLSSAVGLFPELELQVDWWVLSEIL